MPLGFLLPEFLNTEGTRVSRVAQGVAATELEGFVCFVFPLCLCGFYFHSFFNTEGTGFHGWHKGLLHLN